MATARFRSAAGIPVCPPGMKMTRIGFTTCPGSDLSVRVAKVVDDLTDPHGVPADAWWTVSCQGLPDRTFRLMRGGHSLNQLVQRYGFFDAQGCLHHKEVVAHYEPNFPPPAPTLPKCVTDHLYNACGVPQYHRFSGICWFASLCWVSFSNLEVRRLIQHHLCQSGHADIASLCDTCLSRPEDAEKLRHALWHKFSLGDDVQGNPQDDGCNGCSEFSLLCARAGVPLLRYSEQDGSLHRMIAPVRDKKGGKWKVRCPSECPSSPHLLLLRFCESDHENRWSLPRFLTSKQGVKYKLIGMYLGQSKCGHQIGACSHTGHWKDWSFGDADLHKDGIGPIFLSLDGEEECNEKWWEAWKWLVHLTKFGQERRELCNFSPHNPSEGGRGPGQLSVDMVFLSL